MHWFGPSDIKYYVKKFLLTQASALRNKTVVDIPAGCGYSSAILADIGANVEAYDLFPESFQAKATACKPADLMATLPIQSEHADMVLCQEGIEHIPDQLKLLCELNRILKTHGTLLITTPNYSNLIARTSFLLGESEKYKMPAPNELDSIWYHQEQDLNLYYGHIFLIGMQKLRLLAKIAGFKIKKIHHTKVTKGALLLFPLQYPFILLSSIYAYLRMMKRHRHTPAHIKQIYREILQYNIDPRILLDKTLFVELEKVNEPKQSLKEYLPYATPPA